MKSIKSDPSSLYAHLDTASPKDGWVILGPGGGGCVHLLTISPHRPDTLLVSCDMTAGYITHNNGKSWRQFNLKSRQYAYAFDPIDPDVIYVGTSGLFRSGDNGQTWRLLYPDPAAVYAETRLGDEANHAFLSHDNWPGKTFHTILIDPEQPDHLFTAIKKDGPRQPEDDFYSSRKSGLAIYFSTDRGKKWQKLTGVNDAEIHRLAFDPGSPVGARRLFAFTERALVQISPGGEMHNLALPGSVLGVRHASCGTNPQTGKTVFYLSTVARLGDQLYGSELWKSDDLGQSWQQCTAGLKTYSPGSPPVFSQVSACEQDARRAYLIAERFPELDNHGRRVDRHGILRSCDQGQSWEWVVKMDDDTDPPNRTAGWAERDYGTAWGDLKGDNQISPKGRFAWDVVASPVDPEVCYSMDFSTVFKTQNGGASWEQLVTNLHPDGSVSSRGIDVLGIYDVVFDPFNPEHIALPITDAGMFHSFNQGRTWQHALNGVPRHWINTCYSIVFDPQVKGRAWSAWSAMHDIPRIKSFVEPLLHRHQGGICRTDDGLQTWQSASMGLPKHALCTHLLLDPASPPSDRTIYAAVFNHGVFKSCDDGRSWAAKNNGLDPANPFAWRLARRIDGALYLVVVKNRLKGRETPGALYTSSNEAESWQTLPLPEGVDFPNDLACDPEGRLYLACWPRLLNGLNQGGGVFCSEDSGKTWKQIFSPQAHVYSAVVDPQDANRLYLATFDAGAYRSTDRGQTWDRLKGFNFQWCYRAVPDPHHADMLYLTTFGSSVWYGPAQGVPTALEDIVSD